MNISKQAIEAAAKANWVFNGFAPEHWNEHHKKDGWLEEAEAMLKAAIPHLRGEGKSLSDYGITSDAKLPDGAQPVGGVKFADTAKAVQDVLVGGFTGPHKADCNIPPKNVQSPPEIETQVAIDPDDVERVARAIYESSPRIVGFSEQPKEIQSAYRKDATTAIRAMKGQLWGVWVISEQHWYEHAVGSRFVTTDLHAANVVKSLASRHYRVDCEVRPYTAPREETAEEIAMSILTPPMFYSESFMKDAQARVAQALREAEKRGAAKCG